MRVDHDDMALGRQVADAVQDQRRAGRLAGAGGAEQRKMLAQHRIDIERRARVHRGIDRADLDMRPVVGGIDLLHVIAGHRIDVGAGRGIAGDAAPEAVDAASQLFLIAFAQKIDIGDDRSAIAPVEHQRPDIGDQPAIADPHLHLAADLAGHGEAGVGIMGQRREAVGIDQDLRTRPGYLEHHAQRLVQAGRRCGSARVVRKLMCARHLGHEPLLSPAAGTRPAIDQIAIGGR